MEPPDLSLIEISSEDDPFLEQLPAGDFTSTFLDCSPLHLPRSMPMPPSALSLSSETSATKVNAECRGLSSSSFSNKENLNTTDSISGMPNLSIERQRMKRSRKGGGYNMRKSLAWDRAFLTEEGVLDSLELSMISGNIGKLDGGNMPVIDEGRDSSSLNSDNAGDSANLKTLEEDLHKEMPSGYANERRSTNSSFLKRDSLAGGSLASVSKSSQKIPLRRSVSRSVSKGGVTSSAIIHASQKRLLTMGSAQVVTRNSKIPKFPVSKQDTCLPHMTINHISGGGSCSKPNGIAQPATQKSLSLKASSNIRNASAVKARFKGTPKSTKSSAESARKDTTKSSSAMHTSQTSKLQQMTSNKELPTDGANVIDCAHGFSRTIVSSHSSSINVGDSQKGVQEKGLRPSGLRKPSPSLRYFSEVGQEPKVPVFSAPSKDNIKPSNLPKPSISTLRNPAAVNRVHDLKLAQLLQGAHDKGSEDEYTKQKAKYPVDSDNEQSSSAILVDSDKKCISHVPASLINEERDNKDTKTALSIESGEANARASIVFQEHETSTDENISEKSFQPCLEVQIINDSERNKNCQQQLVEDMGYISSVVNHEVTLGFQKEGMESCSTEFNKEEKHNQAVRVEYQQLHVDNKQGDITVNAQLSTDISECLEVQDDLGGKDDSLLLNDDFFKEEEFSLNSMNHGSKEISNANPEVAGYKPLVMNDLVMLGYENASISYQNNTKPADDGSQLSRTVNDNQLPEKSNSPSSSQDLGEGVMDVQIGGQNLFPNEKSSLKLDEGHDYDVLVCEDGVMPINKSDGGKPYNLLDSEEKGSCTNCTTAGEYNSDLSTMKVSECSEMLQDDVTMMDDSLLSNGTLFFKDEQFLLKSENHDSEQTSSVNPDVQAQRQPELKGKSRQSHIPEVSLEDAIEVYHSSITSQGGDIQTQSAYTHEIVNSCGSDHGTSVEFKQRAEVTNDANNQVHEKQLLEDGLLVQEPMAQNNNIDLTSGRVSEHNCLKRDSRERLSGIDQNVYKVYHNPEEVEDQTDSLTHRLNNGNNSTDEATDLEVPTSEKGSNNQATSPLVGCDTEESSSPGESHELQPRNVLMKAALDIEHDKIESSVSPTECETTTSEDVHGLDTENKCNKNAMNCIDEEVAKSKQETCLDDQKRIGPPPNVIPFSDEWLAAIEAAGEEILTKKTGAVQNSPPDKPIPEPSPWSPVKRKTNQVIGPFDCTKYTNAQHNNSG